ncbi:MAG: AI-2E family transporter [Betaproteobacteria bacterium]|nr:AI-2E family transporter [Betaproteobacteria bacterium]
MGVLARPQLWAWLAIAAAIGFLVWLLAPILVPFLFAAILAYTLDPLVERLTNRHFPRTLGVLLVMLVALGLIVGLLLVVVPLFYRETQLLAQKLPTLLEWTNRHGAPWLREKFHIDLALDVDTVKGLARDAFAGNEDLAKRIAHSLGAGGLALLAFLVNLALVPVVLFYLLRDWNKVLASVEGLIPPRARPKMLVMAADVDRVLAEFLRGEMLVILIMGTYYTTALSITGLEFALPIGVITGLAVLVPYVGITVGLFLATAAALLQFDTFAGVLWVWLAIGIGQALEGMLVTPLVVGHRIGLHPVAVIFALLAFGHVFGFFGVLLALPASAALLVGLRHLRAAYVASALYERK